MTAVDVAKTAHLRAPAPLRLLHSSVDVHGFFATHLQATIFPATAGVLFYGWRALLLMSGVVASTGLALLLWRRVGKRGGELRVAHGLWMAVLLALTLPAQLAAGAGAGRAVSPWPIIPAAGLALAALLWIFAGDRRAFIRWPSCFCW